MPGYSLQVWNAVWRGAWMTLYILPPADLRSCEKKRLKDTSTMLRTLPTASFRQLVPSSRTLLTATSTARTSTAPCTTLLLNNSLPISKRSISSTMPPKKDSSNGKTAQGHDVKEPPNTGWKGPVPAKEGGREEGYLSKVSLLLSITRDRTIYLRIPAFVNG